METDDLKHMSRKERVDFYLRQIKQHTPPKNRKQEILLKVYRQLLESAQEEGIGSG